MTDRPRRTPEQRAAEYAEGTLGVNAVYERAQEALAILEDRHEVLRATAAKRREIDSQIVDREVELTIDERATQSELSATAFDKHIKVVLNRDEQLRSLRAARDAAVGEHERAEQDADRARMTARMESARLEELGGLLHFYAAVKHVAHQANDDNTR